MLPKKLIISFLAIFILHWLANQGYETTFFRSISTQAKHVINFLLLLGVALSGYWGISSIKVNWLRSLWKLTYSIICMLVIVFGIIDLANRIDNQNFRDFLGYLKMFFISPMPFVVASFIGLAPGIPTQSENSRLKKKK